MTAHSRFVGSVVAGAALLGFVASCGGGAQFPTAAPAPELSDLLAETAAIFEQQHAGIRVERIRPRERGWRFEGNDSAENPRRRTTTFYVGFRDASRNCYLALINAWQTQQSGGGWSELRVYPWDRGENGIGWVGPGPDDFGCATWIQVSDFHAHPLACAALE